MIYYKILGIRLSTMSHMSYITFYLSQKVRIYCSTIWESFVKNALRLIFTLIIQLWSFIFSKTTCTNRTTVRPGSMQYGFTAGTPLIHQANHVNYTDFALP